MHGIQSSTFQLDNTYLSTQIQHYILDNTQHKDNFPVQINIVDSTKDPVEKDDARIGTYFIHVQKGDKVKLQVGSQRTSRLDVTDTTASSVIDVLGHLIPTIYLSEHEHYGNIACYSKEKNKDDVSSMRALKYASEYEVIFSLMNNNPEHMKMDWEIREALDGYLRPFLKEVSVVSNLTINSQIQNYAPLSLKPKYKERVGKPNYYYFEPQHLPHFVNSAEWNLASTVTSSPTINFILYSPSQQESPLRIHDTKDQPLLTNSFLIPRWGGIVIKNPPKSASMEYKLTKSDLQPIMKTFLSQLRTLIGVKDLEITRKSTPHLVTFEPAKKSGITALEKDNLIRSRTFENVANTISTLKSLGQLVDEIPNMVVQDHINSKVRASLNCLTAVRQSLSEEDYLKALRDSIDAIELAEKAFFDPTMVSMLYFPDEHKYAIYMPLFVPTSVPLLAALVKEIKKLKQKKKKEESKEKEE
ncbi:hypothetical protein G6F17_006843 [Rhizopus arrhizus]|nr:hypothetical protein G6F23_008616 [Rhizopus arrhizus]KAG0766122.1 hypothetical protein G6F24_003866 [Rhizopus arrhizus]KAG0795545.1 hypothetical protein G6F22_005092 [Rhizopus arrhizus]KAG0841048.1 hypothetical protein G6F19_001742 [Rhizopus arrhizus]KAG0853876.1 hypothetical protein G6F17_006843 [Rhizopus arrhizus]